MLLHRLTVQGLDWQHVQTWILMAILPWKCSDKARRLSNMRDLKMQASLLDNALDQIHKHFFFEVTKVYHIHCVCWYGKKKMLILLKICSHNDFGCERKPSLHNTTIRPLNFQNYDIWCSFPAVNACADWSACKFEEDAVLGHSTSWNTSAYLLMKLGRIIQSYWKHRICLQCQLSNRCGVILLRSGWWRILACIAALYSSWFF